MRAGLFFWGAVFSSCFTFSTGGAYPSDPELFYSNPYVVDLQAFSDAKPWKDNILLHQKYAVEGLSLAQIAGEFFCSKNAIRNALIAAKIPLRKKQQKEKPSNPAYGTRIVHGQRIEHLAERRVVQTIVDMRKQGLSFRQIAEFLGKVGVPTKKRGYGWHYEVVRQIYLRHAPA